MRPLRLYDYPYRERRLRHSLGKKRKLNAARIRIRSGNAPNLQLRDRQLAGDPALQDTLFTKNGFRLHIYGSVAIDMKLQALRS